MKQLKIYLLVILLNCSILRAYEYNLSIFSIFQNEAPYMKEWIEFHKMMGVEHFYLYNNLSQDNYMQVIQPYIDNGEITLVDWTYTHDNEDGWTWIHTSAFQDAVKRISGKSKWLACIDLDEFLFTVDGQNLSEFLKNYEEFAALSVNWQNYGTSHVKKILDNELMIEKLIFKAAQNHLHNYFVKSIFRPEYINKCLNAHTAEYKNGRVQVNADKVPFVGMVAPYVAIDEIRLNHYCLRDEYYLYNVKWERLKKRGCWDKNILKLIQDYNHIKDDIILQFVPELRNRMLLAEPVNSSL